MQRKEQSLSKLKINSEEKKRTKGEQPPKSVGRDCEKLMGRKFVHSVLCRVHHIKPAAPLRHSALSSLCKQTLFPKGLFEESKVFTRLDLAPVFGLERPGVGMCWDRRIVV